jgi:hypothetical protein
VAMTDILTLYTSLQPSLLRRKLLKGFGFAMIGALIIVLSGTFLDPLKLKKWGFLLFLMSVFLIAYGLVPYRRMTVLTSKPDMLKIVALNYLEFYSKDTKILSIPLKSISNVIFCEDKFAYGIGLILKLDEKENEIYPFQSSRPQEKFRNRFNTDIFFPFFSKRSFKELQEWLNEEKDWD